MAVMRKLDPALDLMDHTADMTQEATNITRTAADRLYRTTEDMQDELPKGLDVVKEDIQKTMDDIKDETAKLTEAAEWASMPINNGARMTTSSQNLPWATQHTWTL